MKFIETFKELSPLKPTKFIPSKILGSEKTKRIPVLIKNGKTTLTVFYNPQIQFLFMPLNTTARIVVHTEKPLYFKTKIRG